MYAVEAESVVYEIMDQNISLEEWLERLEIVMVSKTETELQFDLKNAHPSLANALRRIMISEVPTMAIHDVIIRDNDSVFPDEYLAHRLGLIPIHANPSEFEFRSVDDSSILAFKLKVDNKTKENMCVYSNSIEWVRLDNQENIQVSVKPDVLICKLAPGNKIDIELIAEKGLGKTHTKWSPVAICTYKLMPKILIEKDFFGDDAVELQKCFSPGVIGISDNKAVVENPRLDMISREVYRNEKFKDHVKIYREDCWFCFTIESIALDPVYILKMGVKTLIDKCNALQEKIFEIEE